MAAPATRLEQSGSPCAEVALCAAIELAGQLAEEMGRRWRAGERLLAEDAWAPHPQLADHPEAVHWS